MPSLIQPPSFVPGDAGELRGRYQGGDRNFRGLNLDRFQLQGQDYRGADFSGASFRAADLSGANLGGCSLQGCDFTSATLAGLVAREANMSGAVFDGVDLVRIDFLGANVSRASFVGSRFVSVQLGAITAEAANFSRAVIRPNCDFVGGQLVRACFDGADVVDADFSQANMSGVSFAGSTFEGVKFGEAAFEQPNLNGVVLTRSSFASNDLGRASLRGAKVGATSFRSVNLENADLSGLEVDDRTSLTMCVVNNALIERNTLECLSSFGGLTRGQLQSMRIVDGLSELRSNYSGYWQWLHMTALVIFLFPYVVYSLKLYGQAEPVCVGPACSTVGSRIWTFIQTGGTMGDAIVWGPFVVFWFSLAYNLLRFILLAKTKSLELSAVTAGFPPKFSLGETAVPIPRMKRSISWALLLKAAKYGFYVNGLLVLYHLVHFMGMYVQRAP